MTYLPIWFLDLFILYITVDQTPAECNNGRKKEVVMSFEERVNRTKPPWAVKTLSKVKEEA